MRRLLSLVLIAVMIFAVTGCGAAEQSSPTTTAESGSSVTTAAGSTEAAKPQEIHWVAPGVGEKSWQGLMVPILEKFQEQTGIKVVGEHYAYADLLEVIEVKIGSGSTDYDVVTVDGPLVAAYASRGYLSPMTDYFTQEELSQFTKSSVDGGTWKNTFYSPPFTSSSQVLWYNTDLLQKAGVTIRENDEKNRLTYEEIVDMAKKVQTTLDPNGTNGIFGLDFQQVSRVYQMNPIANSLGAPNIGNDGFTLEGVLNGEPWIKALTWYQDLVKSRVATRGISADELPNYFYSDKLAFMIGTTFIGQNCDNAGMTHYGYTYLPTFKGYENSVGSATGSWGFGINAASKYPKEAADFIKFVTLGEGNDMWLKIRGDLPARNSVLEEITKNPDSPGYLKIGAYEAVNTAVTRAVTPVYNEYNTIMDNLWEDIRNGEDVKTTVTNAIGKFNTAVQAYK